MEELPLIGPHDTLGFLALAIGSINRIAGWNRKRHLVAMLRSDGDTCSLLAGLHTRHPP